VFNSHQNNEVEANQRAAEVGVMTTGEKVRKVPEPSGALLTVEDEPEALVFATSKGTPLNSKNLYNRELAPACDNLGLPRISWHSFRHTHATLLHDAGESLKTAQSLLGHSDLETTLGVYTHAIPDSQKRAVERVAGVLNLDEPNSASEETSEGFVN
jgi:integrase